MMLDGITSELKLCQASTTSHEEHKQLESTPRISIDDSSSNLSTQSIKHYVEYRHIYTGEVIYRHEITRPDFVSEVGGDPSSRGMPMFQIVTTYTTRQSDSSKWSSLAAEADLPVTSLPKRSMHIHSPTIINALQSVVEYYPDQDLAESPIIIQEPYAVLAHHEKQLAEFREKCKPKRDQSFCIREKDAYEHLGLLLDFMDKHIMPAVREERERNAKGMCTFDMLWVSLKPGTTIRCRTRGSSIWEGYVVKSICGGTFQKPTVPWSITYWCLKYDGEYLGRYENILSYTKFDGESIIAPIAMIVNFNEKLGPEDQALVERGKEYYGMLKKRCLHYKGTTANFPHTKIDGLVMVDLKGYYEDSDLRPKRPELQDDDADSRTWITDCNCLVCKQRKRDSKLMRKNIFEEYDSISPEEDNKMTDHQYFLCSSLIYGFVFKTRTWEILNVLSFSAPKFDELMMENLVMDTARRETLKALARSYIRLDQHGQESDREAWAADFVQGKGNGLILLLHGKPGVGKTCTAECIAAFTKRPLMVLTSSDIGTNPERVESVLRNRFITARSWGAVLLIDEADVFMERRTTADLTRNSLVAGFLRALEFYDGILFLTTNRIGSFDDAFTSRIHIKLYYPDFTDRDRRLVWQTFIDKLDRERGDYIRLKIDAREYLDSKELRGLAWNGREIRNAIQTAVALAEYEADKDVEGKIQLKEKHLKSVIDMSKDFKMYLDVLHHGDEGKRAERHYDRFDSYKIEP